MPQWLRYPARTLCFRYQVIREILYSSNSNSVGSGGNVTKTNTKKYLLALDADNLALRSLNTIF